MSTDRLLTTFLPIKGKKRRFAPGSFWGKDLVKAMMVLLFVLWVVFNGRLTWEIAAFGVVLSGVVYAFCCAFLGYDPRREAKALRKLPRVLGYVWLLVKEIVKSNLALIRVVYSRRMDVKPQLITFHTPLCGPAKSVLADSITLTPGTITVHCEDDRLTVHCLNHSLADGIEDTAFQQKLAAMNQEVSK